MKSTGEAEKRRAQDSPSGAERLPSKNSSVLVGTNRDSSQAQSGQTVIPIFPSRAFCQFGFYLFFVPCFELAGKLHSNGFSSTLMSGLLCFLLMLQSARSQTRNTSTGNPDSVLLTKVPWPRGEESGFFMPLGGKKMPLSTFVFPDEPECRTQHNGPHLVHLPHLLEVVTVPPHF